MAIKSEIENFHYLLFFSLSYILLSGKASLGQTLTLPPSYEPHLPASETERGNEDQIFEEVFGQRRNRSQKVIVPFFIDEQQRGQVLLTLGASPAVRIQAAPLLTETAKVIRPDIQETLTSAVDAEGNLSLEVLQQNGLLATFDRAKLELQIQVPPALRRTNVANLQGQRLPPGAENALRPSTFSGYVNFRVDQDYIWSGEGQIDRGRQPLIFAIDGALNYKNWVFEGRTDFLEGRNPALIRGDLRIVRDAPNQTLRYVLGDLSIPITGYQNTRPQLGFSVERNFGLQPYIVTRPISQYEFFLETPSRVDVLVNGRLERTLQLPAGRQDIRDLPLSAGTNNVELVITDDVGRVQRLNFSNPVAAELLAPGVQQFAYSLGFPSTSNFADRTYDFQKPTLTLSHRLGISNNLTAGGYFQGDFDQQVLGVEGTWATRLGNFGWDIALSHDNGIGIDYAARLRYEYLQVGANNAAQRSFRITVESRGENFTRVGEEKPRNDFLYDITADYSQKLFWDIRGNLSIRYEFGREIPDTYRFALGLSRSFRNGLNVSLNVSERRDFSGFDEQRAYISLSWLLPQGRQFIQATSDITNSREAINRLTWNYNPLQNIGVPRASVGLTQDGQGYDITGRLSYTGYRFTWDLSHDTLFSINGDNANGNITQFSFGTALVFADGHFAWSRPINNSFAIVVPQESVRGQVIGVNPSLSGYITRIDNLGFGVVPNLDPYNITRLLVDAPNLPVGMDLGERSILVLPTYRSGTVVRVGTDATVFLRGVLLNPNGEPVSLQSAQIVSLSDPNGKPVTFFTNRAGRFATSGLKPGRYEIRLFTNPPSVLQFEIPSNTRGIYDLGTLKLPVN
jgi:outer membrane usher protein